MYVCLGLGKEGGGYCRYRWVLGPIPRSRPFVCTLPGDARIACYAQVVGNPETQGASSDHCQNARTPDDHGVPNIGYRRTQFRATTHTAYQPPRSWQARKQGASWGHRHGARTLDKHQVTNTGHSRTRFRINTHSSSTASVLASPENKGGGVGHRRTIAMAPGVSRITR